MQDEKDKHSMSLVGVQDDGPKSSNAAEEDGTQSERPKSAGRPPSGTRPQSGTLSSKSRKSAEPII